MLLYFSFTSLIKCFIKMLSPQLPVLFISIAIVRSCWLSQGCLYVAILLLNFQHFFLSIFQTNDYLFSETDCFIRAFVYAHYTSSNVPCRCLDNGRSEYIVAVSLSLRESPL